MNEDTITDLPEEIDSTQPSKEVKLIGTLTEKIRVTNASIHHGYPVAKHVYQDRLRRYKKKLNRLNKKY